MTSVEEKVNKELLELAPRKYSYARNKYQECKILLANLKPKIHLKQDESFLHNSSFNLNAVSTLKLPPCDTESFEGGYANWPAFRDLFWGIFGTHPGISSAQKLYHLRSKTKGEARKIVEGFDLVDDNFLLAWNALKGRYENIRILVQQQMKHLFGLQMVQTENSKAIRQLQRGINDSLSIFKTYQIDVKNWDPILVYHCTSKLPDETLKSWEASLPDHKELPTWKQLDDFLSKRVDMLESFFNMRRTVNGSNHKAQVFQSSEDLNNSKLTCKRCKGPHSIRSCGEFKKMSVTERTKFVYANKICANCLSSSHFKPNCTSKRGCGQCNLRHHTLLHLNQSPKNKAREYSSNPGNERTSYTKDPSTTNSSCKTGATSEVNAHFSQHSGATILPTAVVNIIHAGEQVPVRVLLDGGSEKSFITKRMQQNLGLPTSSYHTQISGLGGTIVGNSSAQCSVTLKSTHTNFKIKINAVVVTKLTHFLPSKQIKFESLPDFKLLKLSDPTFYKPSPIDMIIGSDFLPHINLTGIRSIIENGLEARESHFGWYLSGPLPVTEINTFTTSVTESNDIALHEQMRQFWELENVQNEKSMSNEDAYCEEFYKQTTYRQADGRYVTRLPLRQEFPENVFLGTSRDMALAQYHRMEKTLEKTPELKLKYEQVLQEYIDLDHMEHVTSYENAEEKQTSFFLPHHAVVKPENKTTKVRVVFNGSKKTKSGYSLNDVLYPGPVLQTDIIQVILGWRYYKFVFTGDIEKMYRQILVHHEDRRFQKIFFRPGPSEAIQSFQLKTVTFGINCAPFIAIRTLKQLSDDCKELLPAASIILKDEVYVDDVLSGGHTIREAKEKKKQLIHALSSAAFPLKKMTANNKSLLEDVARENLLDEEFLKFDESSTVKTLGIRWNGSDNFLLCSSRN